MNDMNNASAFAMDGHPADAVISRMLTSLVDREVIEQILNQSVEWAESQKKRHGFWTTAAPTDGEGL